MRYSKQRNLILDIVASTDVHPTVEWVYERAKRILPSIGIATVYRNLNTLADAGQIRKMIGSDGVVRFDAVMKEHYHMQCRRCGRLFDLSVEDQTAFDQFKTIASQAFGIEPKEADLADTLFYGCCPYCAEKKKEE
ncbi:Fur family transcriptional regulator [Ihubacter sp. rT4E-8]|uniref:Fur family transcriptional regulator n=1 Tax=unclassified Ihubacter TaxID=2633299 RepID=UPI00137961BF